jgi:hypothetical protein
MLPSEVCKAFGVLQEVVQGPPSPWKLSEHPKDTHMTLERSYNGETVQVDIMVNDQVCLSLVLGSFPALLQWCMWYCEG